MAEDRLIVEGEKSRSVAPQRRKLGVTDRIDAAINPTQAIGLMRSVDVALGETRFAKLLKGHDSVLLLR